ncbi:11014_t:CDS:2 [Diversispora eburnea]|uniref:11014_t:CDS:1 n=1 Tax=Diversispora eburnea TaxID=1213867 RepID=A0A9N8WLV6_9GLOM|nr:11014_t:CDS:2 [Diversispora eburnea]
MFTTNKYKYKTINAFHYCNTSLLSNSNKPTRISSYIPITPSPLNPPLKLEKYYLISDIKHDVRIHVGERPNTITFNAHSNMLKSRSKYFKIALSDDWMRKKDGWIILNLPNISPEVFNFILNYFYTGRLTFDDAPIDGKSCLKRIIAADELCLDQLLAHEQSFLITHRSEWIRQNFLTVYKLTITLPALESLKNFCMILLYQEPKLLMNDIHYLDERTLLLMLKNENLQLDEIEIWENLIRWGINQIPMLKYRKPRDWTKDEWDQLSNTIAMFLQFIRFEHISKDDFLNRNNEIYSRLLPSEFKTKFQEIEYSDNTEYIYKIINNKHNKDNSSDSSTFVNKENEDIYHSKEISSSSTVFERNYVRQVGRESTISQKSTYTSYSIIPYTSKRTQFIDSKIINISHIGQISNWIKGHPSTGSKDGFSTDIFHKWCDNYGSPTLIIIKLKNSNEIIGGYNHFNWKSPWLFPTTQHDKYAFIFSLCPWFGKSDLQFQNNRICSCKPHDYDGSIIAESGSFEIEDYEVFGVGFA